MTKIRGEPVIIGFRKCPVCDSNVRWLNKTILKPEFKKRKKPKKRRRIGYDREPGEPTVCSIGACGWSGSYSETVQRKYGKANPSHELLMLRAMERSVNTQVGIVSAISSIEESLLSHPQADPTASGSVTLKTIMHKLAQLRLFKDMIIMFELEDYERDLMLKYINTILTSSRGV